MTKDPLSRTKVVIRYLPPSLQSSDFFLQIDDKFLGRYNWSSFKPGKQSYGTMIHSLAYINFMKPEDVFKFAEFFDGHMFVSEKGSQFRAVVEYAPSQRVPKTSTKTDSREGTIYKDPDYLEFLKDIAKPVEHLPSAEIQLERREAEKGSAKETPVVTPLMEFIRRKRAVESKRMSLSSGKASRKIAAAFPNKLSSYTSSTKRFEKKYILKESTTTPAWKNSSDFVIAGKQDDQLPDIRPKSVSGKKKILLLKGKDREAIRTVEVSSDFPSMSSTDVKSQETGETTQSLISSDEASFCSAVSRKDQMSGCESSKRPPRPANIRTRSTGLEEVREKQLHGQSSEATVATGTQKHFGRRGYMAGRDESSGHLSEGRQSRRVGVIHSAHEKQMWVQKSSVS